MAKSLPFTDVGKSCSGREFITPSICRSQAVLLLWIICVICLMFVMLWRLFIDSLWSPEGKGLASWLLFVVFIVFLLLPDLVF